MPRPITATIHLPALASNLAAARRAAPASRVWAVIKADAYGHGIERAYPALRAADGFALLEPAEAARLRALGWNKPILLLEGFFDAADVDRLGELGLSTTVHDEAQLRLLEDASRARRLAPRSLDVCLKLNTGMNRLGFDPAGYGAAWRRLQAIEAVRSVTHMTHFSDADGDKSIAAQMAVFHAATHGLPGAACVANSAGTLWHAGSRMDWVRAGIMLYGASPAGRWEDVAAQGLQPAMTLSSRILAVRDVPAGEAVGYGSHYVAPARRRIGVVACGYADGYPRTASSHAGHFAPVWVDGVESRTVGRVSMDMLAVDLSDCPAAGVGTPVELWGRHVPIDRVAAAAGTLGYELMCAVAPRVPVMVEALPAPAEENAGMALAG
ncbi:alanine racemase [Cupriavidus malaysiensis]|uniref:Alanine racemase n=1 Tax=Cupriavidus malaysiensis TaxID=367825 RepID=A0ABN4TT47_9BURK|nr:alanine racemase [Cupriavidus malaysiensis]AOZ10432.1 alanine racemase [Cupriavidus malaysiensis]